MIKLDGEDFDTSKLSDQAKAHLDTLVFINEQILQKNNEVQVADSARIVCTSVLKAELKSLNLSDKSQI